MLISLHSCGVIVLGYSLSCYRLSAWLWNPPARHREFWRGKRHVEWLLPLQTQPEASLPVVGYTRWVCRTSHRCGKQKPTGLPDFGGSAISPPSPPVACWVSGCLRTDCKALPARAGAGLSNQSVSTARFNAMLWQPVAPAPLHAAQTNHCRPCTTSAAVANTGCGSQRLTTTHMKVLVLPGNAHTCSWAGSNERLQSLSVENHVSSQHRSRAKQAFPTTSDKHQGGGFFCLHRLLHNV